MDSRRAASPGANHRPLQATLLHWGYRLLCYTGATGYSATHSTAPLLHLYCGTLQCGVTKRSTPSKLCIYVAQLRSALHCYTLHCSALHCTALHCYIWLCSVLHCCSVLLHYILLSFTLSTDNSDNSLYFALLCSAVSQCVQPGPVIEGCCQLAPPPQDKHLF
jgi:hypothetical protein